ncbi:MAG: hypothetical protein V2I56_26350 [Desulfobacteraceae bacterium]|jgi:hypothetical protein|nr:hypothetical protein [Desulfobacteraceae bacterium]
MGKATAAILSTLTSAPTLIEQFATWRKHTKGDVRALVDELKENSIYVSMIVEGDVGIAEVIDKISVAEFKRLNREGFDFNKLKRGKITRQPSVSNKELLSWVGKDTESLVTSIYDKMSDLTIRYPHAAQNKKYRWSVRVKNIQDRIGLLLMHVRS